MIKYNHDLAQAFANEVVNWKLHCNKNKYSSNPLDFVKCQSYKTLVGMREKVLPYINEVVKHRDLGTFPIFGWSILMQEIIGEGQYRIPDNVRGNVDSTRLHVQSWLEHHGEVLEDSLEVRAFNESLRRKYDLIKNI